MTDRLLNQGEVESEIMRLSALLEEETHRFADLCELEAQSDIAYKDQHHRLLIHEANRIAVAGQKVAAAERDARVAMACTDQYAVWRINEARLRAAKEALLSLRHQIDALRTLSANLRVQT